MSEGFSTDWLALREPYDAAARSRSLLERLAEWRASRGALRVVDLGAGTGANLRCSAPALGGAQHWALVEHDSALIAAGERRLAGAGVEWRYRRLDLARDLEQLADEPIDLLTASALLDLVTESWLRRLLALRARANAALYVVLTYDGRIAWEPGDRSDAEVAELVNRHQRTDKGFGTALGLTAAATFEGLAMVDQGTLASEPSDWMLGPSDGMIQEALRAGYADAAASIAPARCAKIEAWANRRCREIVNNRSRLTVGHRDILLLPT